MKGWTVIFIITSLLIVVSHSTLLVSKGIREEKSNDLTNALRNQEDENSTENVFPLLLGLSGLLCQRGLILSPVLFRP